MLSASSSNASLVAKMCCFLFLLLCCTCANANFFLHGTIFWSSAPNHSRCVEFTVQTSWSSADFNPSWLTVGSNITNFLSLVPDQSSEESLPIDMTVLSVSDGVVVTVSRVRHTYPDTSNTFTASVSSCCHVQSDNIPENSDFRMETQVSLGLNNLRSPRAFMPPKVIARVNEEIKLAIPIMWSSEGSLHYRVTSTESSVIPLIHLCPTTGVITLRPTQTGFISLQVVIVQRMSDELQRVHDISVPVQFLVETIASEPGLFAPSNNSRTIFIDDSDDVNIDIDLDSDDGVVVSSLLPEGVALRPARGSPSVRLQWNSSRETSRNDTTICFTRIPETQSLDCIDFKFFSAPLVVKGPEIDYKPGEIIVANFTGSAGSTYDAFILDTDGFVIERSVASHPVANFSSFSVEFLAPIENGTFRIIIVDVATGKVCILFPLVVSDPELQISPSHSLITISQGVVTTIPTTLLDIVRVSVHSPFTISIIPRNRQNRVLTGISPLSLSWMVPQRVNASNATDILWSPSVSAALLDNDHVFSVSAPYSGLFIFHVAGFGNISFEGFEEVGALNAAKTKVLGLVSDNERKIWGVAGEDITFNVIAADAYGASRPAASDTLLIAMNSATPATEGEVISNISSTAEANGVYRCKVSTKVSGDYSLTIRSISNSIDTLIFSGNVHIAAGATVPSHTDVSGPGKNGGPPNALMMIFVQARDEFLNKQNDTAGDAFELRVITGTAEDDQTVELKWQPPSNTGVQVEDAYGIVKNGYWYAPYRVPSSSDAALNGFTIVVRHVPSDSSVQSLQAVVEEGDGVGGGAPDSASSAAWVWGSAVAGFCCVVGVLYTSYRRRERELSRISLTSSASMSNDFSAYDRLHDNSVEGTHLVTIEDDILCYNMLPVSMSLSASLPREGGVVKRLYHLNGSSISGGSGKVGFGTCSGRPVEISAGPGRNDDAFEGSSTLEPAHSSTYTISDIASSGEAYPSGHLRRQGAGFTWVDSDAETSAKRANYTMYDSIIQSNERQ